jgi:DNA polymerase III alpha subunit
VHFLIAAEIGNYCKRNNIYFNLRGSGVSSFILYLLGLSRVNPLDHDLLFERFVNSLRDDLPDIDIDIDSSKRPRVLKWVFEKYDKKVIFVSTHKFFKARSALYEVARAYGFNAEDSHKMSKELPMFASPSVLEGKGTGKMREVYRMASLLEGVYKEYSLHLGGVLFLPGEVKKSLPLEKSPDGFEQVVWDKHTVERLRIFKLDLLGVRGFDVIAPVALKGGVDFNDPEVWDNIQNGRTIGCFQQESPLVRGTLQKVQPRNLHQLAITIAIIRPGPSQAGMKQSYIEKKPALHPILDKIFPRTRGNLIFEEQISVLLHTVTGWNLERSEKVRRDLKKGKGEKHQEEFFKKGKTNGWKEADLQTFWKLAGDFSRYAFNQGHSVSYAYSAYLSAWFKTHHPVTFFCRLFNSGGGYYPLPFYIEEAKRWNIQLLPPDVNLSIIGFKEEKGAIRTGFIFIKGVGMTLASKIIKNRGMGYTSLEDFLSRTGIGDRDLANLMAVSAFDSLGHNGFTPEEREKNWKEYLGFVP